MLTQLICLFVHFTFDLLNTLVTEQLLLKPGFAEVHLVHGVGHPRRPLVHHVAVLEPTPDDSLTGADLDMVILLT